MQTGLTAMLTELGYYLSSPILLLLLVFQLWMLVDAVRHEEYFWAVLIFIFPAINAVLYYFFVYRNRPRGGVALELPGAANRKRIKELEAQIHHLDKAHHYAELADVYLKMGKLQKAETLYRAALERDPEETDSRGRLGQCLLNLQRAEEARDLLESVCQTDPDHDYGYSMMALAEAHIATGDEVKASRALERVLQRHSYAGAKVQLAELLAKRSDRSRALGLLREVIDEDMHAPAFQRRRDRHWVRRSKRRLKELEAASKN